MFAFSHAQYKANEADVEAKVQVMVLLLHSDPVTAMICYSYIFSIVLPCHTATPKASKRYGRQGLLQDRIVSLTTCTTNMLIINESNLTELLLDMGSISSNKYE